MGEPELRLVKRHKSLLQGALSCQKLLTAPCLGPVLRVGATVFRGTQSREEGRCIKKQVLQEQDKRSLSGDASACYRDNE